MSYQSIRCFWIGVAFAHLASLGTLAQPLKVYILAGQSNMEGHAAVRTFDHMGLDPVTAPLLKQMRGANGEPSICDKVWISYLTGNGIVKQGRLTAGYGAQGREPKIGPEFTFGLTLESRLNEPLLIIKTAWGGKSLHKDFRSPSGAVDGKPAGAYYLEMVEHVQSVLLDIRQVYPDYDPEQGYELAGFVWFQGWNDMVDRQVYPNRGKPGGYADYSELLTHFIRDVRTDLKAPKMRFVIGVMGTGGVLDLEKPTRYTPIHQSFREAMAAPVELAEFKGNVRAVLTEQYWDSELGELVERWEQVKAKSRQLSKNGDLSKDQQQAAMEAYIKKLFTPEERELKELGISNAAYHYLGSAKIMACIGEAFAQAMVD